MRYIYNRKTGEWHNPETPLSNIEVVMKDELIDQIASKLVEQSHDYVCEDNTCDMAIVQEDAREIAELCRTRAVEAVKKALGDNRMTDYAIEEINKAFE